MLWINFHNAFQDFENDIPFQYSKFSYNVKVNFSELSDIFWTFFLLLEDLLF